MEKTDAPLLSRIKVIGRYLFYDRLAEISNTELLRAKIPFGLDGKRPFNNIFLQYRKKHLVSNKFGNVGQSLKPSGA
jgi:hypothetical protein